MQLTRDDIISTAVELLDSYGFADMTMRRIATTLGVVPGALYWHVANKQALIAEIAVSFVSHLDGESTMELVKNLRSILLAHRDGAELVTAALSQANSPTWNRLTKIFADSLSDTGADDLQRDVAAQTLIHLVLGATVMDQNRTQLAELTATAEKGTTSESDSHDFALLQGAEFIIAGVTASANGSL